MFSHPQGPTRSGRGGEHEEGPKPGLGRGTRSERGDSPGGLFRGAAIQHRLCFQRLTQELKYVSALTWKILSSESP